MTDSEVHDDYQSAGFGGSLAMGKAPALLIIDVVMAYFQEGSPLYAGVESILEPCRQLAQAARAAQRPVIFTGVRYQQGGVDGGLFYRKVAALRCFDAGNPLGNFHPLLMPEPRDLVIIKQYASAFFGTSLASTLTTLGCDSVIITGLSTSGCVRASGLDAIQHGFAPVVVREAVGDRQPSVHEANLFDLQAKYADVLGVDAVLAWISKLSG